ncbi:MAG: metallophosphoesterase [Candidatus Anstonellales archaeon]
MNLFEEIKRRNVDLRISIEAKEFLEKCSQDELDYILNEIRRRDVKLIDKNTVAEILSSRTVIKQEIRPDAKDIESQIEVDKDITYDPNIHNTRSTVDDFIELYRSRFRAISKLFNRNHDDKIIDIVDFMELTDNKNLNRDIMVIGVVFRKGVSKNGNLVLDLEIGSEDLERFGVRKFIVPKDHPEYLNYKNTILEDDIIKVYAKWNGNFGIIREISYPDLNSNNPMPNIEDDFYILYISDLHFGSKHVNMKAVNNFLKYIHDPMNRIASKIKYIVIAGDNVEGVGIYPGQEKELDILDIEKQYIEFNKFIEQIPEHIEVIFIPGNHDATRRNEPTEIILKDLIWVDSYSLPNPVYVKIHGIEHLIYHGTSLDSYINTLPGMSYSRPEQAAIEMIRRRHMSSIIEGNPVAPLREDFLVIRKMPHVFNMGHVHKKFVTYFKPAYIVNPGTFQNQTPFQEKVGLNPDVGYGCLFNPKQNRFYWIHFI